MLHPNTGAEFGKEIDEVRAENASLRTSLSNAEAEVARLREAVDWALATGGKWFRWDMTQMTNKEFIEELRRRAEKWEVESDEKWMREHFVDLIFRADGAVSLHAAGIIGRVIAPTIHAAIEAAKKEEM